MIDESEDDDCVNFEETFITISAKIRELFSMPAQVNTESNPSNSCGTAHSASYLKLPKLNPPFSNKYDEWYLFFNTFQSMIY